MGAYVPIQKGGIVDEKMAEDMRTGHLPKKLPRLLVTVTYLTLGTFYISLANSRFISYT